MDVCLYANIRIFKQITTFVNVIPVSTLMFVSMQIYEFLSKSQPASPASSALSDVCLYANIRIFKQITTLPDMPKEVFRMFVSMQIYEFLSKSQRITTK